MTVRSIALLSSAALLGTSTTVAATSLDEPTCPPANFESIDNFDLDSYISKRWYIQQQMPVSYLPESQNRCVFADYRKRSKVGLYGYQVAVHNYAEEVEAPHKPHDSGDTLCAKVVDQQRGQLKVAPCKLPSFLAGDYWVLNYDNVEGYALVSGGVPKESAPGGCRTGSGVNGAGLWIFTRQQQRNQTLVDKVRGLASAKGLDLSVLKDVDQSDCSQVPAPTPVCPPPNFETIKNIDLDTFIAKKWNVQQQMAVSYLPKSQNRCVYAEYQKRSSVGLFGYEIGVHNHAEEVEAPHKEHDSGKTLCAKVVDGSRGKLSVAPCFLPSFLAGPYWVLDYSETEGYALISGGEPTEVAAGGCRTGSSVNNAGLWIFTRQRERNDALVNKVRAIAAQKGFDLSVLNDVEQSTCNGDAAEEAALPKDFLA